MSDVLTYGNEVIEPYLDIDRIAARVAELGREISAMPETERPVIFVCVLKGSFMFFADLLKAVERPSNVGFLAVSSYEGGTKSTGAVRLALDLTEDINDRDVIIVEDIVDTGLTMDYLLNMLLARRPRSLKVCTLLHKPAREKIAVPLDFVGFTIDDVFVVGYGLDYEQRYRDLPFIGVMSFN
jgi:hypoxanthine phosphoribosyltransferase